MANSNGHTATWIAIIVSGAIAVTSGIFAIRNTQAQNALQETKEIEIRVRTLEIDNALTKSRLEYIIEKIDAILEALAK